MVVWSEEIQVLSERAMVPENVQFHLGAGELRVTYNYRMAMGCDRPLDLGSPRR